MKMPFGCSVISVVGALTSFGTCTVAAAQVNNSPEVSAATQRWSRCVTDYVQQADLSTSAATVMTEARQNCRDLRREAQDTARRSMDDIGSAGEYIDEADRQISQSALRLYRQRQQAANPATTSTPTQPASGGALSDAHRALSRRLGLSVRDTADGLQIAQFDVRYLRSGTQGMIIEGVNMRSTPTAESFWAAVEAEHRSGRSGVLLLARAHSGTRFQGRLMLTFDPR